MENFVFTSAGDNTNFDKLWLGNNKTYDVYVIYYGDNESVYNKYRKNEYIKHIEKRKGSKFQNFLYFYNKYPHIIHQYNRFFILDDDIIFSVADINKMFYMSKKYDLDICGPSFVESSVISWNITKHKPNTILTYTNFVEVNTMLFNSRALHKLMKYMVNELIGWGIDILAIWSNGLEKKNKYAIIHCVKCINPDYIMKKIDGRELYKIENSKNRAKIYDSYIKKLGIYNQLYDYNVVEYESILMRYGDINKLYSNSFKNISRLSLKFS